MKKKIIIFGADCHAKVVFSEIIKLKKYEIVGFVVEFSDKGKVILTHNKKKFKNIGPLKNIENLKKYSGIMAVGSNKLSLNIND